MAVLPASSTKAAVWHNFVLWETDGEERSVTAELVDGEHDVRQTDRVALYEALWSRLWSAAAVGGDAVDMIRKVSAGAE